MSQSDPLSDMLTRIRNAQQALKREVIIPAAKFHEKVLQVLQDEGYIRGYESISQTGTQPHIRVEIKYYEGEPVIKGIKRISRPGRRVYAGTKNMGRHFNGFGITIISTPRGVMSDHEARRQNVGGEVLCQVF